MLDQNLILSIFRIQMLCIYYWTPNNKQALLALYFSLQEHNLFHALLFCLSNRLYSQYTVYHFYKSEYKHTT